MEVNVMELCLNLGGLIFKFEYHCELKINKNLKDFICESNTCDICVHVSRDYDEIVLPDKVHFLSQDLIHEYYKDNNYNYCLARGRDEHYLAASIYEKINEIDFYLNDKPFIFPINDIGSILRLLPLNNIFAKSKRLFLHSSQICYNYRGIVFTGPSGMGKTTQSKLWQKHMNAKIICNDRTIITKDNNKYITYGLPIDGSSPIRSTDSYELAAIVVLQQSLENKIERMPISKAIASLMSQMIVSNWNSENKDNIINMIIDLYQDIPVYKLSCTKDEKAVKCLFDKLICDEVIEIEER